MGTTALIVLQSSLGTLIGDSQGEYSSGYTDAINNASKEISDDLFVPLDNMDLITGNILPPFLWSTTALLDFYSEPSGTLLKTTDGDYIRRGSTSAKITASGANDVLYIDSTDYPRLLNVMGKTIEFKDYAHPVDADDDAFLTIQYTESDGTSTTANSTTECDSGEFTLLEKEQAIPDDIKQIQFRMRVLTTLQNVYFDMPRVTGLTVREYLLPKDFQDGYLSRVQIQTSSYSDDACDDLHPTSWETVYGWRIIEEGGYKYLRLPAGYPNERQIRLIGYKMLETLSDGADTASIDGEQVNLLLAYAAGKLFQIESQTLQYNIDDYTDDITAIDTEIDTPVASIDTLKTTIATADTALNVITTAIATATTAVDAVASDIATLQTVIDTAVTNVATVASEDISRYEAAIARNQAQINRDEARRGELKALRDNLIVKRAAKDADIKRLDDQRQRLDDEIARFEAERNRISQKRSEFKDRMARLKLRSLEWFAEYYKLLPGLKMTPPTATMKVGF